mmetsp:Transcript_60144/g.178333  ORF Transcript_60144/g.178333 Transcript_60144/m.178333 type:complete len:91 (-) Transcript_60144:640-912(-)|eukprot:CAMPEP_0113566030 /NCGR_PEP_ID=MMETSP0015_2-20120614/22501_1 /TAXON_ID=2838 /ORGANISM="Odontella" /LENGTH=90 /DNA_ID=CAMNT_0000468283 /DNA_START=97 /DNA_END=369 /DNA_ORIENTATION=- /assembly_acc=CAM_ASM_000160
MGLTAILVGGVSGTGIHMLSNATRKVPISRAPWMHFTFFFVGMWAGQLYVNTEKKLLADVNELRADKGLPPMVGTDKYFKYSPPEGYGSG